MAGPTSPIDIATPKRFGSSSPRNTTSNLTSALQNAGLDGRSSTSVNFQNKGGTEFGRERGRHEFSSNMLGTSQYGSGARPISIDERRGSMAGSLMNGGMSWGNVSMSSWIRDDVIMGSSPYTFQSPSFHSSSYLPKMEANFMKDFACCGETLNSLHELLQHYEQAHAQAQPPSPDMRRAPQQAGPANHQAAPADVASETVHQPVQPVNQQSVYNPSQAMQMDVMQPLEQGPQSASGSNFDSSFTQAQDVDTLDDMEMDEVSTPTPQRQQQQVSRQQILGGSKTGRLSALNLGMANAMQPHRSSTPTTPSTVQGFPLQNNPTVSSVNTPALSTQSLYQNSKSSPDSSYPGTPAELDQDMVASMHAGSGFALNSQFLPTSSEWGAMGFAPTTGNDMLDLCIDEPAKRLFSRTGGFNHQQFPYFNQGTGLTNQRLAPGVLGNPAGQSSDEHKPHKCPVIGCEKAYKNNNGLKYHRQHGHQNQQLVENPDKTFSIVDPVTSIPYPGTIGMEKEKPYRCQVCGKRYKNLNGLKYHKQHSPPCNPDLVNGNATSAVGPHNIQAMNANVAGAGITGMGDGMMI